MNDQKQLIKAINDLIKAVNKNTDAIKENTKLYEPEIDYVESGTPDDLKRWYTYNENVKNTGSLEDFYNSQPDKLTLTLKEIRDRSIIQHELNKNSMELKKNLGDNNVINGTDGLGNPVQYKKGFGGIVQGGILPKGFKPWDGSISTG